MYVDPFIMSSSENQDDYDEEIFGMPSAEELPVNHRCAIRYIRTDITASLSIYSLLGSTKNIPIKLIDISSKGVAIECEKKLTKKKKIVLELVFKDKKKFTIDVIIIHQKKSHNKTQYGLKFAHFNNELGDYILASQQDLVFK